jgi:hypothetical protein
VIAQGAPVMSYVDGDTPLEETKFESAPKAGENTEAAKPATPVETPPSAPTGPPAPKTPPRE